MSLKSWVLLESEWFELPFWIFAPISPRHPLSVASDTPSVEGVALIHLAALQAGGKPVLPLG